MVRRSKRSAKSDQSEEVTEEVRSVEDALQSMLSGEGETVHSVDEESILKDVTGEPLALSDQAGKVTKEVVGETEDVQGGQSEKEAAEKKEGVEMEEGCMSSGLKDPKASSAAVDEVMDHEVASAIAEAEKALASESEAPPKEQTALPAVNESVSEEVVDISDSDEREAERCLYCDDRGFSVNDVDAYVAHLETEHRVVRNAHLLARNTIDTQRQDRLQNARLEAVSPEPFEEAKLPPVEDIESEDEDDDVLLTKEVEQEESPEKKEMEDDEVPMEVRTSKEKDVEENVLDDPTEKDKETMKSCDTGEAENMETGETIQPETNGESENDVNSITTEVDVAASEHSSLDVPEEACNAPPIPQEDVKEEDLEQGVVEEDLKQEDAMANSLTDNEAASAEIMSPDSNKDNGDMLTIMASGEDGFGAEEEAETKTKQEEVLSDLSLSDDDFSKTDKGQAKTEKEPVVEKTEKQKSNEELCTKCDTPHVLGQRCAYILKGSSKRSRPRETSRPRQKVRTLPPELYHHPGDRDRSYRSRSPPPTRMRRAPSPPSAYERNRDRYMAEERERRAPPASNHFGEKRCKLCNIPGHLVKNCPDLFCYVCKQQGHFAKECPGGKERTHNTPSSAQIEPVFGVPPPPAPPSFTPPPPPPQEQQGYAQYYPPPVQHQPHAHPMLPPNSVPPPYPVGVPQAFAGSHYQAGPTNSMLESNKPAHYAEALGSLAPLQAFMNTKLQCSSSSSGYPPSYIELLVTNVGKMFALANLSLPSLEATFFSHGETFLRSRISRELQVYAQQFPKGVNMPIVTETTVEFLKTQAGLGRQFSY